MQQAPLRQSVAAAHIPPSGCPLLDAEELLLLDEELVPPLPLVLDALPPAPPAPPAPELDALLLDAPLPVPDAPLLADDDAFVDDPVVVPFTATVPPQPPIPQ